VYRYRYVYRYVYLVHTADSSISEELSPHRGAFSSQRSFLLTEELSPLSEELRGIQACARVVKELVTELNE
jgi:hypothetical protein